MSYNRQPPMKRARLTDDRKGGMDALGLVASAFVGALVLALVVSFVLFVVSLL